MKAALILETYELKIVAKVRGRYLHVSEPLVEGVAQEGIIADSKTVALIIGRGINRERAFKGISELVVGLPDKHAFIKVFDLPKLPRETLESRIAELWSSLLPIPQANAYYAWQEISSAQADTAKILLVAYPKSHIDPLITALKLVGLKPVLLLPRSFGLAQLLYDQPHTPILIIDSTGDTLTLTIAKNRTARFSTTIAPTRLPAFLQSLVKRLIEYYERNLDGKRRKVAKIIVLKNPFLQVMTEALATVQVPVTVLEQESGLLPAMGLLMTPGKLNLLPTKVQQEYQAQQTATLLRLGVVGVSITVVALTALNLISWQKARMELKRQSRPAATDSQVAALEQEVNRIKQRKTQADALAAKRTSWSSVIQKVNGAAPAGISVVSVLVEDASKKVQITGSRTTREALQGYVTKLRAIEGFSQVTPTVESYIGATEQAFEVNLTAEGGMRQ